MSPKALLSPKKNVTFFLDPQNFTSIRSKSMVKISNQSEFSRWIRQASQFLSSAIWFEHKMQISNAPFLVCRVFCKISFCNIFSNYRYDIYRIFHSNVEAVFMPFIFSSFISIFICFVFLIMPTVPRASSNAKAKVNKALNLSICQFLYNIYLRSPNKRIPHKTYLEVLEKHKKDFPNLSLNRLRTSFSRYRKQREEEVLSLSTIEPIPAPPVVVNERDSTALNGKIRKSGGRPKGSSIFDQFKK